MTKILLLGANGMLGSYIKKHFDNVPEFTVRGTTRSDFDVIVDTIELLHIQEYDVVINCIGTIKSVVDSVGTLDTILINSVFPHRLATECEKYGVKLIHITTDCVFSGQRGHYKEEDSHDPLDVYGKTKSLGEPTNAMVIRTSIIGEELHSKRSLIEWVKSNNNKTISGYVNHTWNGVTCLELAKFIQNTIQTGEYWNGVRHVFSPDSVTKMKLVNIITDAFNLNIKIMPTKTDVPVYRTLSSKFTTPIRRTIEEQVSELPGFLA